jgi:hypothetical protein
MRAPAPYSAGGLPRVQAEPSFWQNRNYGCAGAAIVILIVTLVASFAVCGR